jgi:transcriptional regulator NrdR family protein
MLNPEYYDQRYIVQCPTCSKRFQTYAPVELDGLQRDSIEEQLREECQNHVRWPMLPASSD